MKGFGKLVLASAGAGLTAAVVRGTDATRMGSARAILRTRRENMGRTSIDRVLRPYDHLLNFGK
jgi:hypothetical protein